MIEQIAVKLAENMWVIVAMLLVVILWAFLQAAIKVLRDMFLVKFFKKKINGNTNNGGMTHEQGEELIKTTKANGVTLTATRDAIETMNGKTGEMHDIICEVDENKFPKFRVMEKKVKEVWDRVVRKANGND